MRMAQLLAVEEEKEGEDAVVAEDAATIALSATMLTLEMSSRVRGGHARPEAGVEAEEVIVEDGEITTGRTVPVAGQSNPFVKRSWDKQG